MTLTKQQKRAIAYARAKTVMAADKYKVQAVQAKRASVVPNPPVAAVKGVKKEVDWSTNSTPVVPQSPAKRQTKQQYMNKQASKQDAMRRAKEYGQKDFESLLKRNKNKVSFLQDALKEEEVELLPARKKTKTIFAYTGQEPTGVFTARNDEAMVKEQLQRVFPPQLASRYWLIVMTGVVCLIWFMTKGLSSSSSSLTPYPPRRIHLLEELIQSAQKSGTPVQIKLDGSGAMSVQLGFDSIGAVQPIMNDPTLE